MTILQYKHVHPRPTLFFLIWKCQLAESIVQRNSLQFSNLCIRTAEVELAVTGIFHLGSSREMVFVKSCLYAPFFQLYRCDGHGLTRSSYENGGTDIWPNRKLSDLEDARDIVLLSEGPIEMHVFLDRYVCLRCLFLTAWQKQQYSGRGMSQPLGPTKKEGEPATMTLKLEVAQKHIRSQEVMRDN